MIRCLPFPSLTLVQMAQAASLFHDDLFGSLPEEYTYEVDEANGQLTGMRSRLQPLSRDGKCRGRKSYVKVANSNPLKLTSIQATNLVRLFFDPSGFIHLRECNSVVHAHRTARVVCEHSGFTRCQLGEL